MTSPFSATSDSTESIMDWFQLHSRQVSWAVLGLVALAGGGWFYMRSQDLKAERAEKAYFTAQRSVVAGNLPLAESDLRKMVARYDGTRASMEGRLLLAQVMFEQGKFQPGVDELRKAEDDIGGSREFGSAVHLVLAGGLEQLKKFTDAAREYELAAKAARFDSDRQRFESQAAAASLAAGDKEKAKAIWTRLGADSKGTVAGEARVRLGELAAAGRPQS
ncbi:MAG TPA: tetratricopeptide repeat protein [Gemmatimonadaceae bacterium]|nr:tetratricopeptide repeat protein [Gemmatimonadaceae bacterium]